jgi:hypothetical protein
MSPPPRRGPRRRIAFVTKTAALGGTEKHLIDVLAGLDLSRVEPVVLCLGDDVYREPLQHLATGAVQVEVSTEPSGWFGYWRLFARLRPAVIVLVNGQLGLFPASAYLAGRLGEAARRRDRAPAGRRGAGPCRRAGARRAAAIGVRLACPSHGRIETGGTLSHWTIA